MLSDEEQAAVRTSIDNVRRRASSQLNADRSNRAVIGFIDNLHRGVDAVVRGAIDRGVTTDCKAGCSYCCRVRVEATEPEVFRIAQVLKQRPAAELAAVVARLRRRVAAAKTDPHAGCSFLDNNLCSIYAIRPAVCRKTHSLAVEACQRFAPTIPQDLAIVLGAEALMNGTAEAYRELNLPASGHELNQAVLAVLTDDTAEARWCNGAPVFEDPLTPC